MARILVVLLASLTAVSMAGCSSAGQADRSGATGTATDTATLVAEDIAYRDIPDRLAAGDVAIELVNEDQVNHNVVIEELGSDPVIEAPPGETATGTVALEPGNYLIYCSVPGHRQAGMEATLSVE